MITIRKGKNEFKPHIAVCHMDAMINGGSANGENTALVLKAQANGEKLKTILKALGSNSEVLEKASYRNLQNQLSAAVKAKMIEDNPTKDYVWVDIEDFDEDMVVFYFDGDTYSSSYEVSEAGIVTLTGDLAVAVPHRIYTSEDGTQLVLKDANAQVSDSDEATDEEGDKTVPASPENKDNKTEDNMSKENQEAVSVEAQIQKALSDAKALWVAEAAEAELVKSTTASLEKFTFIEKEDVAQVVKSMVAGEGMELVMKAFEAAQTKVDAAEAEVVKSKEEFGNKEQVGDDSAPSTDAQSATEIMKAKVAAAKAARQAK